MREIGRQSYDKTEGGFGYIHLRDVPHHLPEQLDTMLEAISDVPGLILDLRAVELAKGVDTQIRAAEEWLTKGLPKEKVPYEASRSQ